MMAKNTRPTGIYVNLIEPTIKGILVFFFIASVLFSLASFIWYRTNVMRLANEVYQLEKQKNKLVLEKDNLNARVLQLENYSRILKLARKNIGLIPATSEPRMIEISEQEYDKMNGN